MTLTQKTPWAEFLWAKRSLEENPLLYWHQHGRLHGQNSYGRTLTWRKTTAPPTLTQKALWAGFLWANARSKPYGTSNGELLRAGLLWVILWKTCGQKSHGRPKPCGHSMGHLSTRSYGHLTCLDIFSVGQLLIFTFTLFPPSPKSRGQLGTFSKFLTRRRSSRKCRSFSLRWPFYRARSWFTTDITIDTS